jgi:ornithine cyclodeaminase/alanine dehydrogenase-like protein (mu-crystallin family)
MSSATAVDQLESAVRQSDIIVTCTPSNQFFLKAKDVRPGAFIAAVGADNEQKQELEPRLLVHNKTVVDILDQAETIGELHHAIESGLMAKDRVYAELGEVVAGVKLRRSSQDETIIFDSTGMALQDVIVASAVYEKAVNQGSGESINLGGEVAQVKRVTTR